jgi:Uncharacterized protein, possibly involved in utilization of glycolate and propanediol
MGATISIGKARTAVFYKKPTRFFEELINKGRSHDRRRWIYPFDRRHSHCYRRGASCGGIGVSGAASANQDEELALAGAAAFSESTKLDQPSKAASASEVSGAPMMKATNDATFIDAKRIAAAFMKGQPLLETAGYKVHASRRVEPGQAEIHTLDTDVIYVVEGSATLVTGGKAIDGKEIAPNEIRGTKIEGGEEHQIGKGEVIIIPNGVPHQFTAVTGELHYFVCKPTASAETHLTTR